MKIGFNMLLWTPFVTEEHFGTLQKLKATGYDGVEVNLEPTPLSGFADESHQGKAGELLPQLLGTLGTAPIPNPQPLSPGNPWST